MPHIVFKLIAKTIVILLIVSAAVLTVFSVVTARCLAFPKGLTLEGEKQWAVSNGVWGNLEDYHTEEYTVAGKDGYTLHCELLYSDETKDSNKYVIISHGYNSNRNGAGKYVPVYDALGARRKAERALCRCGLRLY